MPDLVRPTTARRRSFASTWRTLRHHRATRPVLFLVFAALAGRAVLGAGGGGPVPAAPRGVSPEATLASHLDPDAGAIRLDHQATHLRPGDTVDLYALLTGAIVATGAEVLAVDDGRPIVAVARDEIPAVVRTFTTGDVVAVLTAPQ